MEFPYLILGLQMARSCIMSGILVSISQLAAQQRKHAFQLANAPVYSVTINSIVLLRKVESVGFAAVNMTALYVDYNTELYNMSLYLKSLDINGSYVIQGSYFVLKPIIGIQ